MSFQALLSKKIASKGTSARRELRQLRDRMEKYIPDTETRI